MTKQCKDCGFASPNKLREVIKDVISCVNNEYTNLDLVRKAYDNEQAQRRILEQKLEKIKEICKEAPAIDSELSLRILEVIEGAEE